MTKKIFISYAKKDARNIALGLADALETVDGISVWIDRSLKVGLSWELQIQKQIDECDVVIVLYSPDINRHKLGQPASYVLNEIGYAFRTAKKPIIPVMAIATDPPIALTDVQYIDFTGVIIELVVEICDALEVSISHTHSKTTSLSELEKSAKAIRAIIGDPFEWCEVPAGGFFYGKDNQLMTLPAFAMAKYPITYGQFEKFIDHRAGYFDGRWWQVWDIGRETSISYHESPTIEHPRTNISWYDAVAFCQWLAWKLDSMHEFDQLKEWAVRLPTESEWEKAARGIDGRTYPWGNEFNKLWCNTAESGIGQTSPVTQYSKGASPYGITDMCGNVWEWCLTSIHSIDGSLASENLSSNAARALRGGCWDNVHQVVKMYSRAWNEPKDRDHATGFRIMRPL